MKHIVISVLSEYLYACTNVSVVKNDGNKSVYLLDLSHDAQHVESGEVLQLLHAPLAATQQLREQLRILRDVFQAAGYAICEIAV